MEERESGLSRKASVVIALLSACVIYPGNAGFPGLLDDPDASHVCERFLRRHDCPGVQNRSASLGFIANK
jgi:hypothetical protein